MDHIIITPRINKKKKMPFMVFFTFYLSDKKLTHFNKYFLDN